MNTRNGGRTVDTHPEFGTQEAMLASAFDWIDTLSAQARAAAPWLCAFACAALVAWCLFH